MPVLRNIKKVAGIVWVIALCFCGKAGAQTPEELQRQLQDLQQQIEALKGAQNEGAGQQGEAQEQRAVLGGRIQQGGQEGEQRSGEVIEQPVAVMLRPMETGRSVTLTPQRTTRQSGRERQQAQRREREQNVRQQGVQQGARQQEGRQQGGGQQLPQQSAAQQSYNYYYGQDYNYPQNPTRGGNQTGTKSYGTGSYYGGGGYYGEGSYGGQGNYYERGRYESGRLYNKVALKTNALYWVTGTPNLGIEFGLGGASSMEISAAFNKWGEAKKGTVDLTGGGKSRQLDHTLGKAEVRFWFQEKFYGHFLGLHLFYTDYDIYGVRVPLLFEKDLRYDGHGVGIGLTYGYRWAWSERWGLDLSIGAGMILMNYEKYAWEPTTGGTGGATGNLQKFKKTYLGPTNLGLKLYFMIN